MKQVKIGQWPAKSLAAAVAEWEKLRDARDAGRDPAGERRAARAQEKAALAQERAQRMNGVLTVKAACDVYWKGHIKRHRAKKGADEIRRMFDKMLGSFGDLTAVDVTRTQAFEFLDLFSDIPVQGGKLRSELGAAWDYCLDAGKLSDTTPNWWRQIMRGRFRSKGKKIEGKPVGTGKRVLSEAELSILIPWLPNFSRTVADALTLYLWTDTRGSEIVSMEAHEITEEADGTWWTIPKAKTKNARHENATDLRVPLIGRAQAIVRRRLENAKDGYLFPSVGGDLPHVEQKVIQTAVHFHQPYSKTRPESERPRLPVTRWSPHDLRRTSRTLLAALGCPDPVGEAIMRHMQPGVKGIYNRHAYDKERREWLTRLSAHLEKIATHP